MSMSPMRGANTGDAPANWFDAMARRHAGRVLAVDDAGVIVTYDEIARGAAELHARIGPGKRLVLQRIQNTARSLGCYLTALAAGHAVLPVVASMPSEQLQDLVDRYEPELVIGPEDSSHALYAATASRGDLHADLAVLLSTSGSTGSPKVARFTTGQMAANAESIATYLCLTADDAALAHLPISYSFGMSIVHSHFAVGGSLRLTTASMMEPRFWKQAELSSSISGVPFHFEMLERLSIERKALPKLRMLTQAGGRLPPERVQKFAALADAKNLKLFVMYGQTEAGPRIAYLPPERAASHPDAIGIAIPGVSLELIDDTGRTIEETGREGELVVRSPAVMLGYAEGRSNLSSGDMCHGRLETGDLAVRDVDGLFHITGRRSSFIKVQGNRVSLPAVEHALLRAGFDTVCVGRDDRLYIVVENRPDLVDRVRVAAIEALKLPPRSVVAVWVDEIPRNTAQKVLAAELLSRVEAMAS